MLLLLVLGLLMLVIVGVSYLTRKRTTPLKDFELPEEEKLAPGVALKQLQSLTTAYEAGSIAGVVHVTKLEFEITIKALKDQLAQVHQEITDLSKKLAKRPPTFSIDGPVAKPKRKSAPKKK